MIKKLLNPFIAGLFCFVLAFGMLGHLMYGHIQTSKYHYITQHYYMVRYLPDWMLVNDKPSLYEVKVYNNYTGEWSAWYKNLSRQYKGTWLNGHREGKQEFWYPDGSKLSVSFWKDKRAEGKHVDWYRNGLKESEIIFKDGKEISEIFWNEDGSEVKTFINSD